MSTDPKLEPCVCMSYTVKNGRVRCGVHIFANSRPPETDKQLSGVRPVPDPGTTVCSCNSFNLFKTKFVDALVRTNFSKPSLSTLGCGGFLSKPSFVDAWMRTSFSKPSCRRLGADGPLGCGRGVIQNQAVFRNQLRFSKPCLNLLQTYVQRTEPSAPTHLPRIVFRLLPPSAK